MEKNSLAYAQYWCNSLSESTLACGRLYANELTSLLELPQEYLKAGCVPVETLQGLFPQLSTAQKMIPVVLRPLVYQIITQTCAYSESKAPLAITPIITLALLTNKGKLYPVKTCFARDLLSPIADHGYTVSTVKEWEKFWTPLLFPSIARPQSFSISEKPALNNKQWNQYFQKCEELVQKICTPWLAQTHTYITNNTTYISALGSIANQNQAIQKLYEHICKNELTLPLFENLTSESISPEENPYAVNQLFGQRIAHPSDQYALKHSQREALAEILNLSQGKILAVNAPVGTNKHELIHCAIAIQWAHAALQKSKPPISVVVSENLASLDAIIESFTKPYIKRETPFTRSWIPRIRNHSAFFPSKIQEKRPQKAIDSRDFFKKIESPSYLSKAKEVFLNAAKIAFPKLKEITIANVVESLHEKIRTEVHKLDLLEITWNELELSRKEIVEKLGNEPQKTLQKYQDLLDEVSLSKEQHLMFLHEWSLFKKTETGLMPSSFSWVFPLSNKSLIRAKKFITKNFPSQISLKNLENIQQIESAIHEAVEAKIEQEIQIQKLLSTLEKIANKRKINTINWAEAISNILPQTGGIGKIENLMDVDMIVDTTKRFHIFQLVTRYWEGRWLLAMLEKTKRKSRSLQDDKDLRIETWQNRMMITPCLVSTCQSFPEQFKVRNSLNIERSPDKDYLFNFADLLIVDEAAQITPEIVGASFALAKKALVIGDSAQSQPLSAINQQTDIYNLQQYQLLTGDRPENDFPRLANLGKTSSSGNVFRIAQCLSSYHQKTKFQRGIFLAEQTHCFDDMVEYFNPVFYHNQQIPLRGTKEVMAKKRDGSLDGLPALGYFHINGICQASPSGSYQNIVEAKTIAAWLSQHQHELEHTYRKKLNEIVAIVTPFNAQAHAIADACNSSSLDLEDAPSLFIGTPYALQGKPFPIVIFSNVHTKHLDGILLDQYSALLNVAITHAHNSFLLFADMDIFESAPAISNRGKLISLLTQKPSNALRFDSVARQDLIALQNTLTRLHNVHEHTAFITNILDEEPRDVLIACSDLTLHQLQSSCLLEKLSEATHKKTHVTVCTDLQMNRLTPQIFHQKVEQLQEFAQCLQNIRIKFLLVANLHHNLLLCDHNKFCIGSHNWFETQIEPNKANQHTSFAYSGDALKDEIKAQKLSLLRRKRTLLPI